MFEIFHVLKYKFIGFVKFNNEFRYGNFIKSVGSTLVFAAFAIGTFIFTKNVIGYLIEEIHIGLFLLHRFLSMLMFVFFFSINAGNIVVAYSTLYKSKEVSYLMTKPLSHSNLFIIKLLDNFFYSSATFLLIGGAVLFGYGTYFKLDILFYPFTIVFIFLPFVFIAAILGAIILIVLIKLASKFGLKFVIFLLAVFYIIFLFAFFKLTNPKYLVNEVMKHYPNVNQSFSFLDPFFSIFLPNHWFAESLYWYVNLRFDLVLPYVSLLILTCGFLFICVILLGQKYYYKTWLISLELVSKRESLLERIKFFRFGQKSFFEPQTEVLLKKEFRQFFRDPSQWIHLSVMLFLISIFIFSIAKVDLIKTLPFLQTVTYLIIFLFNSFLISSITLRFLYPILSIEAEAFWKMKSAPLNPKKLILCKFIPAFLITLFIAEVLNFFSHLPIADSAVLLISSSINIVFISLSLSVLNFGLGIYFVTFNEKNPIRVASSQGASLSFLLNLVYLVVLVVVLFIPVNEHFMFVTNNVSQNANLFIWSTLALGIICFMICLGMFSLSSKILKQDF